jgi:hypothetical protein
MWCDYTTRLHHEKPWKLGWGESQASAAVCRCVGTLNVQLLTRPNYYEAYMKLTCRTLAPCSCRLLARNSPIDSYSINTTFVNIRAPVLTRVQIASYSNQTTHGAFPVSFRLPVDVLYTQLCTSSTFLLNLRVILQWPQVHRSIWSTILKTNADVEHR